MGCFSHAIFPPSKGSSAKWQAVQYIVYCQQLWSGIFFPTGYGPVKRPGNLIGVTGGAGSFRFTSPSDEASEEIRWENPLVLIISTTKTEFPDPEGLAGLSLVTKALNQNILVQGTFIS